MGVFSEIIDAGVSQWGNADIIGPSAFRLGPSGRKRVRLDNGLEGQLLQKTAGAQGATPPSMYGKNVFLLSASTCYSLELQFLSEMRAAALASAGGHPGTICCCFDAAPTHPVGASQVQCRLSPSPEVRTP